MGSGPAGLQSAIHAAGRKVSALALGRLQKSGAYETHIGNYCGICGDNGTDLLNQGRKRLKESGVEFLEEDATDMTREGEQFVVSMESGRNFKSKALVFAMGISRNRLGLKKNPLSAGVSAIA